MRSPESELDGLRDRDLHRELRFLESKNERAVISDGAPLLNFSSNDYLGLAGHPSLLSAARSALAEFGASAAASRLVFGGGPAHRQLEEATASFFGKGGALTFANGYCAAVGVVGAVLQKGDTAILDKRCHASLIDGARLSGAAVRVFPHNGLEKLERLLRSSQAALPPDGRTLVVTESAFSMDGDLCPLADIVRLKNETDALLLLDEAHAFGVLGPGGRGLAHREGFPEGIDFLMATFGKAAGSAGGCVAAAAPWIDLIANRARSFIYSTAPPPAQAAAATAGLTIIGSEEGEERRARLRENTEALATALALPSPETAIFPLMIGSEARALATSETLRAKGFLVPAIRYPTVARGSARLRITVSAAHSMEDVHALAEALHANDICDGA